MKAAEQGPLLPPVQIEITVDSIEEVRAEEGAVAAEEAIVAIVDLVRMEAET